MPIELVAIESAMNCTPAREWASGFDARSLAAMAVEALLTEAKLTPKPGLVDRRGGGAHHDLSLLLLELSAHTLEPFFASMADAAQSNLDQAELREELGAIGRRAEARMLEATGGVNTHRGAIWALGLLVASAVSQPSSAEELCERAGVLAQLPDRFAGGAQTHGARVRSLYCVEGARGEASAGFPHIRNAALPMLRNRRSSLQGETAARIDTLLAIMRTLPDTCLLHRGGPQALASAQQGAARVLAMGGYNSAQGRVAFQALEDVLLACWASPGGSADLLAATLFTDSLFPEAIHA